ncbi:CE295 protein, partial [Rhynochetos jubatus]|nr:CE295 protein [Rhynochetos jubatus]
ETESGGGIMEEPELTLVSSSDVSIAESDTERPNGEKFSNPACVDQSELGVFTEEGEFFPLAPDADYSTFARPDSPSKARSPDGSGFPSQQTAVMLLEFASTPGSLQESFVKRKKIFVQNSLRRGEEIKNKEREDDKPEARQFQRGKLEKLNRRKESLISEEKGAAAKQLKKVGEVRVSSPEDRTSGETELHQPAASLPNQPAEVRKEEKTRQETRAKTREKAKEFQKVTASRLQACSVLS